MRKYYILEKCLINTLEKDFNVFFIFENRH